MDSGILHITLMRTNGWDEDARLGRGLVQARRTQKYFGNVEKFEQDSTFMNRIPINRPPNP
jgi:hypothetical protein